MGQWVCRGTSSACLVDMSQPRSTAIGRDWGTTQDRPSHAQEELLAKKPPARRPAGGNRGGATATATTENRGPKANPDAIAVTGQIVDALPNAMFTVALENGHNVLGHLSGRMRKNFIRVLPGDRVTVELSPYDLTRGRITYRHR